MQHRCSHPPYGKDPSLWVCLQDVDAAFVERKAEDAKGVTFSGVSSHLLQSKSLLKRRW